MSIRPKFLIIVLVVLVLIGFLIMYFVKGSSVKAYEFLGQIDRVEGNNIYMHGNYLGPNHPEFSKPENAVDVKVIANSSTDLVKIVIYKPVSSKNDRFRDPKNLKKETMIGSIEDLASGKVVDATIITDKNIYGKTKFSASNISYYWLVEVKK